MLSSPTRSLAVILALVAVPHVSAQSQSTGWAGQFFKALDKVSRVTIRRDGLLQTTIEVPEDVYLSVYWTGSMLWRMT